MGGEIADVFCRVARSATITGDFLGYAEVTAVAGN